MFSEDFLKRRLIHRARISKRVVDDVAKLLLKTTGRKVLSALKPPRLGPGWIGEHAELFLTHDLIIQLVQSVTPRGITRERLAREVVMSL